MRIRKSDTCSACRFRHGTSRRNRKSAACQPCRLRPGVFTDAWKSALDCKVVWLVDSLLSCHKPKFPFTGPELRTQNNGKASNLGLRIYATPLRLKPLLTTLRVPCLLLLILGGAAQPLCLSLAMSAGRASRPHGEELGTGHHGAAAGLALWHVLHGSKFSFHGSMT